MPSDRESSEQMEPMKREGVLLEDHVPETPSHPKDIKHKAKRYLLCRPLRDYASFGFNTSLIPSLDGRKPCSILLKGEVEGQDVHQH